MVREAPQALLVAAQATVSYYNPVRGGGQAEARRRAGARRGRGRHLRVFSPPSLPFSVGEDPVVNVKLQNLQKYIGTIRPQPLLTPSTPSSSPPPVTISSEELQAERSVSSTATTLHQVSR